MVEGSCHCGAVRYRVATAPVEAKSCNCSLCRRYGALWAYYETAEVQVEGEGTATVPYVQGDATLANHHCATCGCVTHWRGLGQYADRTAVNIRLMEPDVVETVRIRRFDGADTWQLLD